jgi:hypothetical protein
MKLLVVNLQDPSQTTYRNPKNIGVFMWGRRLSNYPMFSVDENGTMNPITITTGYGADCNVITEQVLEQLK